MVKSLSSDRTLSLINLIDGWFSYALIIFSTTNVSLFGLYFEVILTGAVLVVFCISKMLDNSFISYSSVVYIVIMYCRKLSNVRKGFTAFQKASTEDQFMNLTQVMLIIRFLRERVTYIRKIVSIIFFLI